jgi:hypothetical protein
MRPFGLLFALLLCAAGCSEDKPATTADAGVKDGGEGPSMDPNIDKAVKSVAGKGTASAAASEGPPPNGVFAAGEADKKHPPGAAAKVDLIDKGSEPRVSLEPILALPGPTTMRVAVQRPMSEQAMLTIEYQLAVHLGAEAPKGDDKGRVAPAATAAASAEPAAPPTGPQPIVFVVQSAAMAQEKGGPRPSDELDKILATLKGARIVGTLAENGALGGLRYEMPKGTQPELGDLAAGLGEALELFFSPLPAEPVGLGGYWIASDRATVAGMQLVRYRVTKIDQLQGDDVALMVDIRLYAVDDKQLPPIQGDQEVVLGALDAQGKAVVTRKKSGLLPTSGQMQTKMGLQIAAAANPQMNQGVQIVTAAKVLPPQAPEPKPKAP